MKIRIHDGQPFRVCAVVFTANGEQVQCYDALLPWPRAAQGLSSMEAHADPFADHAPCFVETVPAKIQAQHGCLYDGPWQPWDVQFNLDAIAPLRKTGSGDSQDRSRDA